MQNLDITKDRSNTNSEKWNKRLLSKYFSNSEALPFWVADMDFEVAPAIKELLIQRAQNGIFGYESRNILVKQSIIKWYSKRHDFLINKEEIRFSPSILNSIALLINIHSKEGDSVIIQPPVFFHFKQIIKNNSREVLSNPLKVINDNYEMDFEDLERKASNRKAKILILCNPHNPVGRVWNTSELKKLSDICLKHKVLVISDEIHSDIVFGNNKFVPYSSLSKDTANNSVTCFSPAKTFNIATVSDSIVVIQNEDYRKKFDHYMNKLHINKINTFNMLAMQTAYSSCDKWLEEVLIYIEENLDYLKQYIKDNMPSVKVVNTEGTFLVWLNFKALGLDAKELEKMLSKDANIALNSGYWFGREGAGYARMTIACSRTLLREGLVNLSRTIHKHYEKDQLCISK